MRKADDTADIQTSTTYDERIAVLEKMGDTLERISRQQISDDPIFIALGDTIRIFELDTAPLHRLLEAFRFDADQSINFSDDNDLFWYTSRSANPVGELILALFGYRDNQRIELSNAICSGLQLLNFVQDLKEDVQRKHYYIPAADCAKFGLTHHDLLLNLDAANQLVLFECDKIEHLLHQGKNLPELVTGRLRFELRAVLYGALKMIELIRTRKGDVINNRPKLSRRDHAMILIRSVRKPRL
jgi:phytoene/squalene synthetase